MGATALATVLGALAIGGAGDARAHAQMPDKEIVAIVRAYSIPAGRMSTALTRLADTSGVLIVYDTTLTRTLTTRGLEGTHTLNAALEKLLSGSGLNYEVAGDGKSVLIVLAQNDGVRSDAVGAEALPPIDVGAEARTPAERRDRAYGGAGAGQDPYNKSYVLPNASTGTKTDTPVMETPLNIQSVTQQALRDQQAITIEQALQNVSGVAVGGGGAFGGGTPYGDINLRGFASDVYFRNGFRMGPNGSGIDGISTIQLANISSIEVLKGPGATLYGLLEPGGVVNIVTKEPLNAPYYSIDQQIGSFANYRTTIDATGPVTKDGDWLYRLNMSYQDNGAPFGSPIELIHGQDIFIAPTLKWNIDAATSVKLEVQYDENRSAITFGSTPAFNGQFLSLPRNRNYSEHSPDTLKTFFSALTWSHQFDNDWSIKQQVAFKRAEDAGSFRLPAFVQNTGTRYLVERYSGESARQQTAFSTNVDVVGHFDTSGAKHTLLLGGDFYRSSTGSQSFINFTSFSEIDLFNPVHPGTPFLAVPVPSGAVSNLQDTAGFYLQDQIKLPYDFSILAGARYQYIQQKSASGLTADALTPGDKVTTAEAVTPRFGLLWRPEQWVSVYGHYADGFGAGAGRIFPGTPAGPSKAQEFEAGVKLEWFDGRLRATADYFNLAKTNVPSTDYAHPGLGFVVLTGEVRSKGVEVDIQGEILPGWSMIATYTNQEVRTTKSENPAEIGQRFGRDPRNMASLWSTYEFQTDMLKGLKIGGGAIYRDRQPIYDLSGLGLQMSNPSYATINLMAAYSFTLSGLKLTAQVNVSNLLDTTYYAETALDATASGMGLGYRLYGAPRTILGSLRAEF
ncbi:Metal-pseudopaline+receptor+CntO [Methylocapsa aurea]|jgi:iron complex outermembrane recepter protein|uniref:TonB-dependent siderophore receptor n=1 Tax=Methylocapsa aurea TaxID=663610 RepID=UPI003D18C978